MGKGLKKTLPNPECELSFYPEELCFVLKKNKKKTTNGIVGKDLRLHTK